MQKLITMQKLLISCLVLSASFTAAASDRAFTNGSQKLIVDNSTGAVTIVSGNDTIVKGNLPAWGLVDASFDAVPRSSDSAAIKHVPYIGLGETVRYPESLKNVKVTSRKISDTHGDALRVSVTGNYEGEKATVDYDLYPEFVMTRLSVEAPAGKKGDFALNYLAPVFTRQPFTFADRTGNYFISVPYDNDAWVRYANTPFGDKLPASYEAAAFFNADTRQGLVIGSVEHDIWKSGVSAATDDNAAITSLEVFGGITSDLTRDRRYHGAVKGATVKSPRMILIPATDWRDGLELFADQCALTAPSIPAKGPRPFGWNSWGKLQTKINFDKAIEVSDFIHDNLQNRGFFDADSSVVVNLDAFWDFGFKPEQHREFVAHCKANGQKAGIYYCPFTDWGGNPESVVGEAPEYKMKDLYVTVDGQPVKFDGAPALDPTHPATKARIKKQLEQFIDWGYEYVKIDFMAHGAYESDNYYDPAVTTGVQAYNQGMAYIDSINDGKMWLNLSIAPLFPTNYAHSRRISCDAWGKVTDTEYVLNALTYGWWLDHLYHYNDADHVVYEGSSDGENRMRITSSALTGVYFLGDDMSNGGDDAVKERIVRNTGNRDINEMARRCKSFRPVEHALGTKSADMFTYDTDDCIYLAVFNFTNEPAVKSLPLRRLGLSETKTYKAKELWSQDPVDMQATLNAAVPALDVKVYRIEK